MSPAAATLARECRSFCKTLSVDPSRCLYTTKKFLHPTPTTSRRHSGHVSARRQLHTACAPASTQEAKESSDRKLKDDLRALLRDVAQPVAVVTSFMPSGSNTVCPSKASGTTMDRTEAVEGAPVGSRYHGATLSSFTSIAMDPYPLVAFALRMPSRMATSLSSLVCPSSSSSSRTQTPSPFSSPAPPSTSSPLPRHPPPHPSHMVINLLSASQAAEAITFSRPDLYPTPFASADNPNGITYTLSPDGLPVLRGVVGALSCRLVGPPIPLHDLSIFAAARTRMCGEAGDDAGVDMGSSSSTWTRCEPVLEEGAVTSELFIAQVVRVEDVASGEDVDADADRTLPLVYHRQRYTSCRSSTP